MRIGIVRSSADIGHGGVFQYEKAFLDALSEIAPRVSDKFVYLAHYQGDLATLARTGGLNYRGLTIHPLIQMAPRQMVPEVYIQEKPGTHPPVDPNRVYFDREGADLIRNAGIDLVLQLSPGSNTFSLRLPFVAPIFDLNHRLQPEFPEVSDAGEFDRREYYYINTCRFATLILVDSEVGKADVLRFYGGFITEDRIRILPYYPPIVRNPVPNGEDCARVAAKYHLPDRYFFYPAQFWRHKNHALILRALRLIAEEICEVVPVVFCGSYSDYYRAGNFKEMIALVDELCLGDRVHYLGLVPDEDMPALYTMSAGLVMPTFFGPTNIPPFEAWHYGRPVISSNIRGIREQIGDAGLLIDPLSPADLAQAMLKLWRDGSLGAKLAEAGRLRLASYSWATFVEGVADVMAEACSRLRSGRTPRYPEMNPERRGELDPADIEPHPLSGMDSIGQVFWRDGKLYRGIRPPMVDFYNNLLERRVIDELVQKRLLIDTWDAGWSTSEFPLVLQHRVLPVVSFASEWCASQLQAAALNVLDLELALRSKSLTLWDVSPWNVVFDATRPYYVDLGSISTLEGPNAWRAREQFEKFYLNPLLLFKNGLPRVARRLLFDPMVGVPSVELKGLIGAALPPSIPFKVENDASVEISALRHLIADLSFSLSEDQRAGYYGDNFPEFLPSPRWTKKHHSVNEILRSMKPKTVFDMGANRGWYAQLAARHGARVVAADTNDVCINELYSVAKASNLPISPLVMEFRFPEPPQGPGYKMMTSAADRFKSEMVFALTLVHHLVFTWYMTFDQIVDNCEMFSNKWVAIEFIGATDTVVKELGWSETLFPWYNLENLISSLERYFIVLTRLPSSWGELPNTGGRMGEMDRTILLCERKSAKDA